MINRNIGNWNTGDWNTGDWNTGNRNTGNRNTGDWNTGDRNTGYRNTGNWNTGDWNTGYLNTIEPTDYLFFNKPCSIPRKNLKFPEFFFFDLTEWIYESDMTEEEKKENESYKTTGGFLKSKEYKEAWRESWERTTLEDRKKCFDLPNWNNEIFKEISGIDVEKELNQEKQTIKIGELEFDKEEVKNRLKGLKPVR